MKYLTLNNNLYHTLSAYRFFKEGERHITRRFNENVLLMVFKGTLRFEEDGVPVEVPSGHYYIQEKGKLQTGNAISDSPKYYYVHFKGDINLESGLKLYGECDFNQLFPLFNELNLLQISTGTDFEITSVFYNILHTLFKRSELKPNSKILSAFHKFILDNEFKDFNLKTFSESVGYSVNGIINVFKKETGVSPYAYYNKIRIQEAKKLLISTDLSVAEISEKCGFINYVNFYKAFRNSENTTPLSFREQNSTTI